ncbi:MAG: hypothetical protein B0D96_05190 [Candidatus Sedimenticola endophacoides]|uniref:Uncharacterized protein n=1 Tax=Candidatus Sedimenticola endophacoides TaxID=2548426 RepID=A0A657PYU4_9GAMM|nr:MAG: hypothetical protein B0D94_03875 [Candidatus Sedimenticola endophacoides]OQX33452.1 MAG: hypothetical protein B0D84_04610 [Candidatus Sedimenticola endophacoides]OQX36055.1 MAG: hypothetical protein B0D96_05190 [Candidatus Sedimenticola endophacoides]OQX40081.1 MAG: hypothetical protein B0D89_09020 [Candidatus Sedimenticola endophacoides]OQX43277.1 MAG: hypothetical protein B0D83_01620 [Candidatus Sedimenticola endophacoides]
MERHLLLLAAAWTLYFLLHSLLASLQVKRRVARRWPRAVPAYRLLYNALALLLLIPPLYLTYTAPGDYLWRWEGPARWLSNALALLALAGFFWTGRHYDLGEFIGLRQWRSHEQRVEDQERLHLSPLHHYVRHPWYSLGLVLIWTREMTPGLLLAALLATLYLFAGSRLEERKLLIYHGERYRRYQERVPGLIPRPWRRLPPDRAAAPGRAGTLHGKPSSNRQNSRCQD